MRDKDVVSTHSARLAQRPMMVVTSRSTRVAYRVVNGLDDGRYHDPRPSLDSDTSGFPAAYPSNPQLPE